MRAIFGRPVSWQGLVAVCVWMGGLWTGMAVAVAQPDAIDFSQSTATVSENDGMATLTLNRAGNAVDEVIVRVNRVDVSTTRGDLAAPGDVDRSFGAVGTYGTDGPVYALALQGDGKIIVGGAFGMLSNVARAGIGRANADGSCDTTFDPGTGANGPVHVAALQADGKVLIAGDFSQVNGTARNRIARLNSDGSLDATFDPGSGPAGVVRALAILADGKIIVAGDFNTFGGTARNRIARLNSGGSLDATFDPGSGPNAEIATLAVQADGKLVIGGHFTAVSGAARGHLARLNADGSLDAGFDLAVNGPVFVLLVQPDGDIAVGGDFTMVGMYFRGSLARLDPDGAVDTAFHPGWGANGPIYAIARQSNGHLLVGGRFRQFDRMARENVTSVNALGVLDGNFGTGVDGTMYALVMRFADLPIIGGKFSTISGVLRSNIAPTTTVGFATNQFQPETIPNSNIFAIDAQKDDGKPIVVGAFTAMGNVARNRIARLNADGTVDLSFDPGSGANGDIFAVLAQNDGKVMIAGTFTDFNGTTRNRIARLNADGSLDLAFDPGSGPGGNVLAIIQQADGKYVIGGDFGTYDGGAAVDLARINADGTFDGTFNTVAGTDLTVNSLCLQPDGKVIVGGFFSTINGTARGCIARLNTDGTVDGSFDPGTGASNDVLGIELQPDGKIIAAGWFFSFNGAAHNGIVRLNANGSIDNTFNAGAGADSLVWCLERQPDGKLLVGGDFKYFDNEVVDRIVRLNADGSLDTTFDAGMGMDTTVKKLVCQPDGKILASGDFENFNLLPRKHLARIHGDLFAHWPASDTTNRTLDIAITDDGIAELAESVAFSLTVVQGTAAPGAMASHTLTIAPPDVPVVTAIDSLAADGVYGIGADIDITVTFTAPVTVTGSPTLALTVGPAAFLSGSGTAILTFHYTVASGDAIGHLDTIAAHALELHTGAILDADGNTFALTLPAPGAPGSLGANAAIAIDGIAPAIVGIDTTASNGLVGEGASIPIVVTFSEPVTLAVGKLQIEFDTGAMLEILPFGPATSATATLMIAAGQSSNGLNNLSPLTLIDSGTLRDAAGNDANLTVFAGAFLNDHATLIVDTAGGPSGTGDFVLMRGGLVIANGGTDALGNVLAEGGIHTLTYGIHNPAGNDPLVVNSLVIAVQHNCTATVNATLPVTVPAGDSMTFQLVIEPSKTGDCFCVVKAATSAPNAAVFNFTASGDGVKVSGCGAVPGGSPGIAFGTMLGVLLLVLAGGRGRRGRRWGRVAGGW